jgi:hypothetical protein
MEITKEFLRNIGACADGYKWFCECGETDHETVINKLMEEDCFDWANWVIVRLMTKEQCVRYAIFAAEQVIGIFEAKYPEDKRPWAAIEAAKKYLEEPSESNRKAAANAAYAANAASYAAYAAAYAVYAAAYADDAAYADEMKERIIRNGLEILKATTD